MEGGSIRSDQFQINTSRRSFSISVGVHAVIVIGLFFMASQPKPVVRQMTWIELTQDGIRSPIIKKDEQIKVRERVVQSAPGNLVDKAVDNAFLGEKTQIVDRETTSTNQVDKNQAQATKQKKTVQGEKTASPDLSQLGVAMLPKIKAGDGARDQDSNWAENSELSPTEYVKGFKESDKTALNTKEYVFFGYFQRIRSQLEIAWHRSLRDQIERLYRAGRQIASDMDHTTRLQVTLNGLGEIVRVQVVEESNTVDLDTAAVKAFNDAGPFPNPPKGITEKDGNIRIRWDFVLKT